MRKTPLLSFILACLAAVSSLGQNSTAEKWTRIDSEKKEVSAAFPPGYIVDKERGSEKQQIYTIIGYRNGVTMEMKVEKDIDARNRLKRILPREDEKGIEFKMNGISARKITSVPGISRFSENVYAVSEDLI